MSERSVDRPPWWRSVGPGLITACVVFGAGSLLVCANVGANYRYELLWLLVVTGVFMGTYVTMAARIGVLGGASPCTLIAQRVTRSLAAIIGTSLFLTCAAFQFSNNLAVAAAASTLVPALRPTWILLGLNLLVACFLFLARRVYRVLELFVKVTVGVILACFVLNLAVAAPNASRVLSGFIPRLPQGVTFDMPRKVGDSIQDPMLLIASLVGTTFAVAAAFYQGNLVREKGWTAREYATGIGDSIAGVTVLATLSAVVVITTATVIPGKTATDIGTLAQSLRPLLGSLAHLVFCVGLLAVAMNPFLLNAIIGGSILADGLGLSASVGSRWSRLFTVAVLVIGMTVAMVALRTGDRPIELIVIGQALTVIANPLMAAAILWLANRKDVMGERRNGLILNVLGFLGLLVVLFIAVRVSILVVLSLF